MNSEEYRFMLWVETSEQGWVLWSQNRRRELVEQELEKVPAGISWRLAGIYDGLLAESV